MRCMVSKLVPNCSQRRNKLSLIKSNNKKQRKRRKKLRQLKLKQQRLKPPQTQINLETRKKIRKKPKLLAAMAKVRRRRRKKRRKRRFPSDIFRKLTLFKQKSGQY